MKPLFVIVVLLVLAPAVPAQMLAQQSDWKKGKRGSPLTPTAGS